MPMYPRSFPLLGILAFCVATLHAQSSAPNLPEVVPLDSLAAFRTPPENWLIAGGIAGDPRRERTLQPTEGRGVLVGIRRPGVRSGNLMTSWDHGDLDLELEFLLPVRSNSGVHLQGRYEVQLYDSWGVKSPKVVDCGSIYERWDEARGAGNEGWEGFPPLANASRAPGLWQHLRVEFEAPAFDASGNKTKNAKFRRVILNGFLIHENVEVSGPTRGRFFRDERVPGPLMFQGDHGPVAIRSLKVKRYEGERAAASQRSMGTEGGAGPRQFQSLEAKEAVTIERGFMSLESGTRIRSVNVGTPDGVHFAYNPAMGALVRAWRGRFLGALRGAEDRDGGDVGPLGPSITFNGRPGMATFDAATTGGWPEAPDSSWSTAGYSVGPDGIPEFSLQHSGISLRDRIMPSADGRGLTRVLHAKGTPLKAPTWILLAEAATITPDATGNGWIIGDREWYLDWPAEAAEPAVVRGKPGRQQLVVPVTALTLAKPVTYTIYW